MSTSYDSRPETYEHIGVVANYLHEVVKELLDRARDHDATKLVDPEKDTFDEYTPKLRESTFGSDDYKNNLFNMRVALEHHYEHNRHHPEHFAQGIHEMNLIDLTEMICDWLAATKRHSDGDIRQSIEINQERFGYGDEIKRLLHNTVDVLEKVSP